MKNIGLPPGTMPQPLNPVGEVPPKDDAIPPTIPPPRPKVPVGFTMGFAAFLRKKGIPEPKV